MSIFSSLGKLVKAIIKKVFNLLKKLFKKLWPLLLIVAALYFGGPLIAGWLATAGAPAFLTTFFASAPAWIGTAATWLTSTAGSALSSAWTWFANAPASTQAAIALGTSYALAPEETADFVSEVGEGLVDLVTSVIPGWLWVAGAGVAAWWLLAGNDKEERVVYSYPGAGGASAIS